MGRYSLVVVNKLEKLSQIINVYDLEKQEYSEKVHIKDIDAYTSQFSGSIDFINHLNQKGIINFTDATFYIVSKYKNQDLHFKVIFNSEMIYNVAKDVKAGHLNSTQEGYSEILAYIYDHIKETRFQESIRNAVTINTSVKNLLLRYIDFVNKEKNREEDFQEERKLKLEVETELKRYKTFRGIHIFVEQYKKYGFVEAPNYRKNQRLERQIYEQQYIEENKTRAVQRQTVEDSLEESTTKVISNVDDYNKEYDEFLSEEEYENAYGANEEETIVYYKRS